MPKREAIREGLRRRVGRKRGLAGKRLGCEGRDGRRLMNAIALVGREGRGRARGSRREGMSMKARCEGLGL